MKVKNMEINFFYSLDEDAIVVPIFYEREWLTGWQRNQVHFTDLLNGKKFEIPFHKQPYVVEEKNYMRKEYGKESYHIVDVDAGHGICCEMLRNSLINLQDGVFDELQVELKKADGIEDEKEKRVKISKAIFNFYYNTDFSLEDILRIAESLQTYQREIGYPEFLEFCKQCDDYDEKAEREGLVL